MSVSTNSKILEIKLYRKNKRYAIWPNFHFIIVELYFWQKPSIEKKSNEIWKFQKLISQSIFGIFLSRVKLSVWHFNWLVSQIKIKYKGICQAGFKIFPYILLSMTLSKSNLWHRDSWCEIFPLNLIEEPPLR